MDQNVSKCTAQRIRKKSSSLQFARRSKTCAAPFTTDQILRQPRTRYSILDFAMSKRKPGTFSATKAVKANARERVGQPKPARIVVDTPRTGRQAKHKPKLEQVLQQEE